MDNFLPADFDCSDPIRQEVIQKLTAFEAIAGELPVYIVLDARDSSVVYMSQLGLQLLGATQEQVRELGPSYHLEFFNPTEEVFNRPRFMEAVQLSEPRKWFSFFQQVATGVGKTFEWYLTAVRPFICDEQGQLLLFLAFALQLDPNHHLAEKAERLMSENLMLKDNYQRFASLTKREKELLRHIASGEKTSAISSRVCVSEKH